MPAATTISNTIKPTSSDAPLQRENIIAAQDSGVATNQTNSTQNPQADATKSVKLEVTDQKTNAPLAPPPKPSQSNNQNAPDYFGGPHNNTHFSLEPNPFEQSFGKPSAETPANFSGLPSVQSLTSPAPLGLGATPDWQNSLRSGPLSPAMLTGPANTSGDYFDSSFRQSFPTPNESSLRSTGLTPGGPSMFPAPSPTSQAIFNSLQSGGATPGTIDFHRTAMNAAARSKDQANSAQGQNMQGINKQEYQPAQQQQPLAQHPFSNTNNSEHDAVNSLYMLANNGQRNPNQFSMPNQNQGVNTNVGQIQRGNQPQNTSPTYQRGQKHSLGGMSGGGMSENGDYPSDGSMDQKGKRGSGKKGSKGASNGRRKAEDQNRGQSSKKSKGNSGSAMSMEMEMMGDDDDDDEDDSSIKNEETGRDGKKLTDEEKRKNFLERNRVAALKCRQRKKQWLANLQAKVEIFTTENDALTTQCAQLREENQNLKALLIQHKDCAVSHQQGLGGARMAQVLGEEFNNPQYGGMMGNQQQMMPH